MNYAITTSKLTRAYGEVKALDDVEIKIQENAITGLLGRNGAGKTTLMSLITAQDQPTAGEILVHGERPFENAKILEQICFIRDNQRYPDDYKLHHALRAAAIFYPNWDAEFASELVELFRVPAQPIIRKFSRGQFSALGIVLTLAARAPITFFDEPYLGLDATSRTNFYDVLLRDYLAHPRTIVLSTHLIDEMEQLLERVVILDSGKVVQDSDVETLRGTAHRAAGKTGLIEEYVKHKNVLKKHEIGGLSTAIIEEPLNSKVFEEVASLGIDLSPVSLQDLVAAYGLKELEKIGN